MSISGRYFLIWASSIMGRALGFIVVVVVARTVGFSADTDAYFVAAAVVSVTLNTACAAIEATVLGRRNALWVWPKHILFSIIIIAMGLAFILRGPVWIVALPLAVAIQLVTARVRTELIAHGAKALPYASSAIRDATVILGVIGLGSAAWLPVLLVAGCLLQALVLSGLSRQGMFWGFIRGSRQRAAIVAERQGARGESFPSLLLVGQAALVSALIVDRVVVTLALGDGAVSAYESYERLTYGLTVVVVGGLLSEALRRWGRDGVGVRAYGEAMRLFRLSLLIAPVVVGLALVAGGGTMELLYGDSASHLSAKELSVAAFGACLSIAGSVLSRYVLILQGGASFVGRLYLLMGLGNLVGDLALVGPFGLFGVFATTATIHGIACLSLFRRARMESRPPDIGRSWVSI